MTEEIKIYIIRINMKNNYLLIKAVFDFVQVLFVNTHNTMVCQTSKLKNKSVMSKTPLSINKFQERHYQF